MLTIGIIHYKKIEPDRHTLKHFTVDKPKSDILFGGTVRKGKKSAKF